MQLEYDQGNLLRGIDNCLGAARSVVQVHYKSLDNCFSTHLSLFQLQSITEVTGIVVHGKKTIKKCKTILSNCHIQLKNCIVYVQTVASVGH